MKEKLNLLFKKAVAAKSAWNYNQYWNVAAVNSSKVRSPKSAAWARWILKSFRTIPCLFFATEIASVFFRLSYFDHFKNILSHLSPLAFFLALCYTVRLTTFVTLQSDWLLLLLRMAFFYIIVEEEKNYAGTSFLWLMGSQEANKINSPS